LNAKIMFCLIAVYASICFGKNNSNPTISGFVYDASNGEALIGTNVYLADTQIGSSTNNSGYYVIPNIPVGTYTLVVNFIGYKPYQKEIRLAVGDTKIITVKLTPDEIAIEKVVVLADAVSEAQKLFEQDISSLRLSGRQLKQSPQIAEADLLRSLQSLPGVMPVSDFSSALYVRGGTPDQNLYLMDGTDVYNPEHAFGLFSTFITDAIKQIDLSKGGFGAKYGGRLSSILSVINRDGNRQQVEGSGSLSLLSAQTTIQAPIGTNGSLSGSIRRTYFDKTVAPFLSNVPNYHFLDGIIKAYFNISNENKLTISGYSSLDDLRVDHNSKTKGQSGTGLTYNWGNRTGSIRWTRVFSPKLFGNFWVTGSRFDSDADFSKTFDEVFIEKNFISDISIGKWHYRH